MGGREEARNDDGAGADQRRIRILFLAANPESNVRLAIDREVRRIDEKLRAARDRDRFELISRWAVRPDDLMQALLEFEPDIVHFSGHGNQDDEILLEDDRGRPFPVSKDALANLFGVLKDRIGLVVLNACYSLPQARAIVEHIGCAVGMQKAFGDEAAIDFASGLYQGLAFGRSIGKAFDIGKATVRLKGIPEDRTPQILAAEGVDPHKLFMPPHQPVVRKQPVGAGPAGDPGGRGAPSDAAPVPRPEGPYSIALVRAEVPDLYPLVKLLAREAGVPETEATARLEAAREHLERAPGRGAPPNIVTGLDRERARALLVQIAGAGAIGTAQGPWEPPYLPSLQRVPGGLLLAKIPGSEDGAIEPFQLACHPVTQALYRRFMDHNPSRFPRGETRPVEGVTRDDALRFCEALSAHDADGPRYRLPTEEEWEHAARAGERHRYAGSSVWMEVACARSPETQSVGRKKPNAWGLFDMSGNVWEWTATGPLKGGSYASTERDLTVTTRLDVAPHDHQGVGLRVARSLR
jgi:hypothetical protein